LGKKTQTILYFSLDSNVPLFSNNEVASNDNIAMFFPNMILLKEDKKEL